MIELLKKLKASVSGKAKEIVIEQLLKMVALLASYFLTVENIRVVVGKGIDALKKLAEKTDTDIDDKAVKLLEEAIMPKEAEQAK